MQTIAVSNPYNGTQLAELPLHSEREAEQMLAKAAWLSNFQPEGLPQPMRMKILEDLLQLLAEKRDHIANQISAEGAKPLKDARIETERGLEGIRIAMRRLAESCGEMIPMPGAKSGSLKTAFTRLVPKGPVLSISAFNHPFNLIIHLVVPAVATGCPVVIKPSLLTPLSCKLVVDALKTVGLPDGWCQMALVNDSTCQSMAGDPRIRHLNFVGSSAVGWKLRRQLAAGVTCTLEHGGSAPAIVDTTADLEAAAQGLARAAFYHAGQVCISTQRIYVLREIFQKFQQTFLQHTLNLNCGDPMLESTDVGPLITKQAADRVADSLKDALAQGTKVLCGNKRISNTMIEPTILLEPPQHSKVIQEEIFGPVVSLCAVADFDEAVARANDSRYCFHAAVYTQSIDRALFAADRLNATCVLVNEHTAFRLDAMPFGGLKDSGQGTAGIPYAMKDLVNEKLIVLSYPQTSIAKQQL